MTNFVLVDEKTGHQIFVIKFEGKEDYVLYEPKPAIVGLTGIVIHGHEILDAFFTKLLNRGYQVYQVPDNEVKLIP